MSKVKAARDATGEVDAEIKQELRQSYDANEIEVQTQSDSRIEVDNVKIDVSVVTMDEIEESTGEENKEETNVMDKDEATDDEMGKKNKEDAFITVNGYRYYKSNYRGKGDGFSQGGYNRGDKGGKSYEYLTQLRENLKEES